MNNKLFKKIMDIPIIKKITDVQFVRKIFLFFIMIQSLLDFHILFNEDYIFIFGFAIPTLVRLLIICYCTFLFIILENDKKELKFIFIYGAIVFVYTVLHCIVDFFTNHSLPSYWHFAIFQEAFYILRMMLPIFVGYIVYKLKISKKEFKTVISFLTLSVSVTIILSNLLKISLVAYTYEASSVIKENFLAWFTNDLNGYHAKEIASLGFFHTANQISGLLFVLLPLNLYFYFSEKNFNQLAVVELQILSMMILGTRTGVISWILILVAMTIIYLFFVFIKKELDFDKNKLIVLGIVTAVMGIIFYRCPIVNNYESGTISTIKKSELSGIEQYARLAGKSVDELTTFERLPYVNIDPLYYKNIYLYEEFPEFWDKAVNMDASKRVGNRKMELLITNDINKNNGNILTYLVGLSYTGYTSIGLYIERDIIVHYFTIGILGMILLLGPYFAVIGYILVKILRDYKNNFNFSNISLLLAISTVMMLSLLSGHLLDELTVSIIIGFITGYLFQNNYTTIN